MRVSQTLIATMKETPADATITSHQLMLRAGLIRKLASGLYTWLPLGLRVLKNVERIVREEMDAIGANECLMPSVQPGELWHESARWDQYGKELLKFRDRHEREFCYGPTHEEVITDLIRDELQSYKQLPLNLYQIQTKFRDEIRPRFGVMRAREFLMKDAYSFHVDSASLERTYQDMHDAYTQIFTRLGLEFRAVLADMGAIGGKESQEFHVLADSGEDLILYSDEGDYAANVERAAAMTVLQERAEPSADMTLVDTPDQKTIDSVCEFLSLPHERSVKTLLVQASDDIDADVVALVLRGCDELNEIKAQNHAWVAEPLRFVDEDEICQAVNCNAGSIGPLKLPIPYIVDSDAALISDFCCGANEDGKHYVNVNWQRDAPLDEVADLRFAVEGDRSPDGKGVLKAMRGIEVGHIFQLGTKYSTAMNATVLDEKGKPTPLEMGCYGIGVSRIIGAAIEQNFDDRGIIWPAAMAPYTVSLIPVKMDKSEKVKAAAETLYESLRSRDLEVLFDDRKERPGVMFADHDLMGIPHRIVVGERGLEQGTVEYKGRRDSESQDISLDQVVEFISTQLA